MIKNYLHNEISFGYSKQLKKWIFQYGNFSLIQTCHGLENAQKIASIVGGAMKRGGMDGMARSNITKLEL